MVNILVGKATSNMLIGPDWARNTEICDICNYDPSQAKDIVKSIKKRLRSRNAKIQLLVLTLLEVIVKNCGDIVHMYVAEKELPHAMVKMVKKKPDFHVREKILILVDTWQEAFGGPRARYPQYFAAYQELLRLGAVFPQRSETSAPVFTPIQTHPLTSHQQNLRNPESRPAAAESSAEAEFPTLSLAEIQNARGIMDILSDMLTALNPANKEGIKQGVIVDLVEQCRTYKHRVVHLVNSTTDESLLSQGLTLNDDLQRLLAKHESISSGADVSLQSEKIKTESDQLLVNIDAPLIDTGDQQSDIGSTPNTSLDEQLLLPAPPETTKADPNIDLLSGDGFNSPTSNSRTLVSVGETQPVATQQNNALDLVDMFSHSYQPSNSDGQKEAHPSQPNASVSGVMLPQYEQPFDSQQGSGFTWNGQINQQQEPVSPVYGSPTSGALPPPPWEAQPDDPEQAVNQPQPVEPISNSHLATPSNQMVWGPPHSQSTGMSPQPMQSGYMHPQETYDNNMAGYGYGYEYGHGYGQGQLQNAQFLEQNMSGLSMGDDSTLRNTGRTTSYVPSGKPSRPEDKLFGDLVDMSKFKPR